MGFGFLAALPDFGAADDIFVEMLWSGETKRRGFFVGGEFTD